MTVEGTLTPPKGASHASLPENRLVFAQWCWQLRLLDKLLSAPQTPAPPPLPSGHEAAEFRGRWGFCPQLCQLMSCCAERLSLPRGPDETPDAWTGEVCPEALPVAQRKLQGAFPSSVCSAASSSEAEARLPAQPTCSWDAAAELPPQGSPGSQVHQGKTRASCTHCRCEGGGECGGGGGW